MIPAHPLYAEANELFRSGRNYTEIARRLGLTREYVGQILGRRRAKVGPGDVEGVIGRVEATIQDLRLRAWCLECGRWTAAEQRNGRTCWSCYQGRRYRTDPEYKAMLDRKQDEWRRKNPESARKIQRKANHRYRRRQTQGPTLEDLRKAQLRADRDAKWGRAGGRKG